MEVSETLLSSVQRLLALSGGRVGCCERLWCERMRCLLTRCLSGFSNASDMFRVPSKTLQTLHTQWHREMVGVRSHKPLRALVMIRANSAKTAFACAWPRCRVLSVQALGVLGRLQHHRGLTLSEALYCYPKHMSSSLVFRSAFCSHGA